MNGVSCREAFRTLHMAKQLIIAEKPSVASDLARVLGKKYGKFKKDEAAGGFSNEKLIITSAVGHLVEQKKPQTKDGKSLPWKMEYLPVMPEVMELEPIARSADRLRKVLKLARSKEVESLVNACDAGREGELIFRNIIRFGGIKKPLFRLWMQSMTDDAILEAWQKLKSNEEMLHLADAAVCRSEADWLVGLNSTRALTVMQSGAGGFHVTPTGRVQTPTLAILAARQKEVLAFTPEVYYEVHATFDAASGSYGAKWIDRDFKRDEKAPQRSRERLWNAEEAASVAERCRGKTGVVEEKRKPVSMPAPLLFDLTSLQKEASNRFGFSASRTLQLAQECYEKHKVLTYPRTDSKFLPNDYLGVVTRTIQGIADHMPEYAQHAQGILNAHGIHPTRRVFDSSKVSDHFAIIPTGKFVNLSGDAARIFNLVVQRFLGVFMPNAEYEDTERFTVISTKAGEDCFYAHGRVLLVAGWRALYTSERKKKDELCRVEPGEKVQACTVEAVEDTTKPPAAYTEATLLTAMENAGKLVEDDELASAMKERGLGTPATRASIIEGLLAQEYIARDGKELVATRHGMDLIDLLEKIGLSTLSSPELTGEWEYRLKQMESGKLKRATFMQDIREYTTEIVSAVRDYMREGKHDDLAIACPECGRKGLESRVDSVSCKHCKFHIRRTHAGLSLSDEQFTQLIRDGRLPVMDGFRSRFGKSFRAGLVLVKPETAKTSWKAELYFENDDRNDEKTTQTHQHSLGFVKVQDRGSLELFENEKQWIIPDFTRAGSGKKGFSASRVILGKQLEKETILRVLEKGKSELISGFVSQRTHRSFEAFLKLDEVKGGVGFEFPPREKADTKGTKGEKNSGVRGSVELDLDGAVKHGPVVVKGKGEHQLLETKDGWLVEGVTVGKNRRPLVIVREMCGVTLDAELVNELLSKGKTKLIKDFVSRKSGRKFEAYLVFNETSGRITYEFPPRK